MTMTRFQPKPSQSQSQSQLHVATLESMASAPTARRIVAFSNLDGKALNNEASSFPTAGQLKAVIPKECFTSTDTTTSLMYLGLSASLSAVCVAAGFAMLPLVPPSLLSAPIWLAYAAVAGTVEMGLWVLAHECGHGAFSKDLRVQDTVGFVLHSILLVPYYSWQRSHAIHHRFTNHMELGETHVPEVNDPNSPIASIKNRQMLCETFGKKVGLRLWGALQMLLHLGFGWPAYLLIGATGGPGRGGTNHFMPNPTSPVSAEFPTSELFPGQWKEKVLRSDIGIAAVVGMLFSWGLCNGFGTVMAIYGGPYLVINCWLVLYTWLQHTNTDVPHFTDADHTYVKGALHTIDRPYDKLDPFGIIDFLHHRIGSTHVAHHFDCSIPHYKAKLATEAIKENFPDLYLYDPTPIPQALWNVCVGCTAVEKVGDKYVWSNEILNDNN